LTVHGKGDKDRTVPLPESLIPKLQIQLAAVSKLHDKDLAAGYAGVFPSTHWKGNIQPLPGISSGSGFSRKKNSLQYREHQNIDAITCTKPGFKRC
jgi:hypothetical protein